MAKKRAADKSGQAEGDGARYVGAGCLTLFGLPFLAIGLFMSYELGSMLLLHYQARSWVETPATITQLELKRHRNNEGSDSHEVKATYQYEYEGKTFTSSVVGLKEGGDNFTSYHKDLHARLEQAKKAGETEPCFVDPTDPASALLDRDLRAAIVVFHIPFIVAFGGVGAAIMCGGWWVARGGGKRKSKSRKSVTEPWLEREDWASGVLRSSNRAGMLFMGFFALIWNSIALPICSIFFFGGERQEWWAYLLLSIFPLAGFALAVWAVRLAIRWYRYGESVLRLATLPGVVGGRLAGVVLVPESAQPERGYLVTLSCVTYRGVGDNRREDLVWQDERRIIETLADHEPGRVGVPIVFTIPSSVPETGSKGGVEWKLSVSAKTPGVDYEASFEVPVFRTADSQEGVEVDEHALSEHEMVEPLDRLLAAEKIQVEPLSSAGSVCYRTPLGRNRGAIIGTGLFTLLWNGIVVGMFIGQIGWMSWVFGAFGLLLVFILLDMALGQTEVRIEGDHWRVRGGWRLRGKEHTFESDAIQAIESSSAMSSSGGSNRSQWNNIVARLVDESTVTLVRHVRSRQAERSLIADLRERAGLQPGESDSDSPWDDLSDAPA